MCRIELIETSPIKTTACGKCLCLKVDIWMEVLRIKRSLSMNLLNSLTSSTTISKKRTINVQN